VAGGVRLANVGFDFDDDAGGGTRARVVHEHETDEIPRDFERWARVEGARQDHAGQLTERSS
jgi:hypothetical protein